MESEEPPEMGVSVSLSEKLGFKWSLISLGDEPEVLSLKLMRCKCVQTAGRWGRQSSRGRLQGRR